MITLHSFRSAADRLWLYASVVLLVVAAPLWAAPAHAQQSRRVALVIGIDAYQHIAPLKKAVGDGRAIAAALTTDLRFDAVITAENPTRRQLNAKLGEFEAAIRPGDLAMFFFSGHGVALGGENILLPADLPASSQEEVVRDEGFSVDNIVRRIQRKGARVTLMVIDACRDNPLAQGGIKNVGATRGLERPSTPQGVFMLFAAGVGQTARDRLSDADPVPTSVFTRHLLPALTTPGLSLVQIAKRVQQEVDATARTVAHAQQPAYYDQIVGEIVLRDGPRQPAPPPVPQKSAAATPSPPAPPTPPPAAPKSPAEVAFARIENGTSIADIEAWRKQFGKANPFFDRLAANRIDELKAAEAEALKPGKVFRDCATCPEMVIIPAGQFVMGSPDSEAGRDKDEGPQRRVTIGTVGMSRSVGPRGPALAVGKFEVTFAEWDACVAAGGCTHKPGDEGKGRGKRPVMNVSWDDAKQYVAWLAKSTGQHYRLLTEAEWEYAARAGTTTQFSFGDTISTDQANYNGNYTYGSGRKGLYRRKTFEVGSLPANAFGLHDMHGNVYEWVEDCYKGSYSGAPTDGTAASETAGCSRVLRGGSWGSNPDYLRAAFRGRYQPVYRNNGIGYRVARSVSR